MAGKEDEVMIEEESTDPVEIELEEEEGDDTVAAGEGDDKVGKTDAAPKTAAPAKSDGSETDEEERERKRQERRERKERQREARERNQAELAELRAQVAEIPKLRQQLTEVQTRSATTETNAGLQKAMADMQLVESVIAKATEDGDGKKLVEAMRVRDTIGAHIQQLRSGQSARTDTTQTQTRQTQAQPQFAAPVKAHIQKFAEDHPWYKPTGNDADSLLVRALDTSVANDGFDPATQDYWDELRDRVQEKLGNKGAAAVTTTTTGKPAAKSTGGPQVGSGRSQVMPGRQTYTLSAERLNAIRDAGKDVTDPAVLKHYAKVYQKYDRENPQTA